MNNRFYTFILLTILLLVASTNMHSYAEESKDKQNQKENEVKNKDKGQEDTNWDDKVVIIPITGIIAPDSFGGKEQEIIDALKKANNAKVVLLEIDSPGGLVSSCDNIIKAIYECKAPINALVIRQAVSGGAMLATAASEIYMQPGSRIGDIQPMNPAGEMSERTAEKSEADVRAIMSSNALHNGYPKELLEAMVTRSYQLYAVEFTNGDKEFLKDEQYQLLEKNMKSGIDSRTFATPPTIVITKGKLLSLAPQDAVKYGLAKKVVKNLDEYLEIKEFNKDQIARANISAGGFKWELDKVTTMLLVICLIVGIAGTFTEAHMPGFGIPGAMGIIGFACFFMILFMHERASPFEIALFATGIIFLVVEIVVLPGFGVAGIIGIICLVGGLMLSIVPDLNTEYMEENFWMEMQYAGLITFGVLFVAGIFFIILTEKGTKIPGINKLFLESKLPTGREALEEARKEEMIDPAFNPDERDKYIGKTGIAFTPLRPAGKLKLDEGEIIDVVTHGEFIEKGEKARVTATDMNRIIVDLI